MRRTDIVRQMRVLLIVLIGQAMATMDGSILVVAAPSLARDLAASPAELQLILAIYTLVFAALVVTGARLGDVLGRRRAFLLGLAGFTAASLTGGIAPGPEPLILARACQGAAAAVMTPQVLSIIQLQFEGERRTRAIGAYSLILAVGVAMGQVVGGLIVGAHLVVASWRLALLINVPVGGLLLVAGRHGLPAMDTAARRRLDLPGVALLAATLLLFVVPFTLGRDAGWPGWVWICFAGCATTLAAFAVWEQRVRLRGIDPLFDLDVLRGPGVVAGVVSVILGMAVYGGFAVSLTLHLQDALAFTPIHAGATFAIYATGFATASLTWAHARPAARRRLPVVGPWVMGAALVALGWVAHAGGWPVALTSALLFIGGVGHACSFSPLADHLTTAVRPDQATDLSGLVLTADLTGIVLGIAGFAGIYLGAAPHGSAHALALSTRAQAGALVVAGLCGWRALAAPRSRPAPKGSIAPVTPDDPVHPG
jgi:MFS family permease